MRGRNKDAKEAVCGSDHPRLFRGNPLVKHNAEGPVLLWWLSEVHRIGESDALSKHID